MLLFHGGIECGKVGLMVFLGSVLVAVEWGKVGSLLFFDGARWRKS